MSIRRAGVVELPRHHAVRGRQGRIAGRVVVEQDDGRRLIADRVRRGGSPMRTCVVCGLPMYTVGMPSTWLRTSSSATRTCSWSSRGISLISRPASSSGDRTVVRASGEADARRMPSPSAALTWAAFASPSPFRCIAVKDARQRPGRPSKWASSRFAWDSALSFDEPTRSRIASSSALESACAPASRSRSRGRSVSGRSRISVYGGRGAGVVHRP